LALAQTDASPSRRPGRATSWGRVKLALLVAPMLIGAGPTFTPVALRVAPNDDGARQATTRLVRSILEYTRWPTRLQPIRLCSVGPALYSSAPPTLALGDGRSLSHRRINAGDMASAKSCDALYLGSIGIERMRAWNAAVRGTAVLTIAENDPDCASEAMFCVIYSTAANGSREISFEINSDAVARSQVRIDPRVLRFSAGV